LPFEWLCGLFLTTPLVIGYGGDDKMREKTYWDRPTWKFPTPTSAPSVSKGGDAYPFVDPYSPLVV
jgi:hypothetical protein